MNKKELKERLDELTKQIKSNSKDIHFTEKLIEELLSVKGQMMVEPLELDCGKKEDEYKGDVYRITLTNKGALYHEYGGYSIFVRPNHTALYETLASIVNDKEKMATLVGEEKERFDLTMSAVAYCLSVPKIVFTDAEFTFDIGTKVIEFLKKQYSNMMDKELQEETPKEDLEFENTVKAIEDLKGTLK